MNFDLSLSNETRLIPRALVGTNRFPGACDKNGPWGKPLDKIWDFLKYDDQFRDSRNFTVRVRSSNPFFSLATIDGAETAGLLQLQERR
jgi:hypothetical protein